jgi:hypothetical protein
MIVGIHGSATRNFSVNVGVFGPHFKPEVALSFDGGVGDIREE